MDAPVTQALFRVRCKMVVQGQVLDLRSSRRWFTRRFAALHSVGPGQVVGASGDASRRRAILEVRGNGNLTNGIARFLFGVLMPCLQWPLGHRACQSHAALLEKTQKSFGN